MLRRDMAKNIYKDRLSNDISLGGTVLAKCLIINIAEDLHVLQRADIQCSGTALLNYMLILTAE